MADQPNNLPAQIPQSLPPELAKVMGSLSSEDKKVVNKYIHHNNGKPQKAHLIQNHLSAYSGPLPPPEMLQAYEAIAPGFANRIIAMAETQSNHRMELERTILPHREKLPGRGQIFAFILGLFGLACGAYCAVNGQPWAGVGIGGATLGGLVSAFLYSKTQQEKDLARKRPQ